MGQSTAVMIEQVPFYIQVLVGGGLGVWILERVLNLFSKLKDRNKELGAQLDAMTLVRVEDCKRCREDCALSRNAARAAAIEEVQAQLARGDDLMAWLVAAVRLLAKANDISAEMIDAEMHMNGRPRR